MTLRTYDKHGALKIVNPVQDDHGHLGHISQVQELLAIDPYRVAGTMFVGTTIDSNFWTSSTSGAGAANTQATLLLSSASGTANNGYAQMQSVLKGRFIFAHPMLFRGAARITATTVALNTRRWGVFSTSSPPTPTDGFYFEQSAAGVLSVVCVKSGTPTAVASGSFNGELGTTYALDTNVHAYEIHYFVMSAEFYIDGKLIHTFTPTTAGLTDDLTLPISWNSVNGGAGVTSGTVEIWAAMLKRLGRAETQPRSGRQSGIGTLVLKRGPGSLHSVNISAVSNNAVVTLYDNTSAAGTTVWASGPLSANTLPFDINLQNIPFQTGLTVDITGASATAVVIYE